MQTFYEILDCEIMEFRNRLTKLVNDLLELMRIESGKAVFKFQEYVVDDIIECAVKPFYQLLLQERSKCYEESFSYR